jgi:hypothetical protein
MLGYREMWLDLTDEETLALLHLLTETAIHPHPDPPRRPAQSGGADMDGARRG